MPPTVPLTKWLTTFISAARANTTKRSSNSSPMNVTLWCRFRFTEVTSRTIASSSSHSRGAVLNPEFRQAQDPRQSKTDHSCNCIPGPGLTNRHAFQQSGEVQDHHHNLNDPIERQHHIAHPVHERQDRKPITIGIACPGLLCKCL